MIAQEEVVNGKIMKEVEARSLRKVKKEIKEDNQEGKSER